jgi:DNA-binding beta-propeller fold protein YncE
VVEQKATLICWSRFPQEECVRLTVIFLAAIFTTASAQPAAKARHIPLPTTKHIPSAAPGRLGSINSFPATIAISPDGRYAALLNDGFGVIASQGKQSISVLELASSTITDFPDSRLGEESPQTFFLGLGFSGDGKHIYASMASITDPTGKKPGSTGNGIAVYKFEEGKVLPERFIPIALQALTPGKRVGFGVRHAGGVIPYPAGLAVIERGGKEELLIANNLSDNVLLLDAATGQVLRQFDLSSSKYLPSAFPYTVVVAQDKRRAWCSLWNGSQVAELDLESGQITRRIKLPVKPRASESPIAPGSHPTAMLLSPDEKFLYVALTNADAVAVVSAKSGQEVARLDTRAPHQQFPGSDPNALAQSTDGKRLFVADASLNAVAVFDVSQLKDVQGGGAIRALGFIPSEWYPSALAVHEDHLLIASGKGQGTTANAGPDPLPAVPGVHRRRKHPYIGNLLQGSLAKVNISETLKKLDELTAEVEELNLFTADPGKIMFRQGSNPIRHVIYVLKENRSYDQMFGDLKVGNGDRSLTMYGEDISPNHHRLALQFGVLDNFYDSGEVSGNGHVWSHAAITSDYNEKTWQITYRGKERPYDFNGTVADEITMEHGEPDIDDPVSGYMWDNLARQGKTYRVYGEFVQGVWCEPRPKPGRKRASKHSVESSPGTAGCAVHAVNKGEPLPANVGDPRGGPSPYSWPIPMLKRMKPTKAALRDHFDPLYPDFNVAYPDQLRADEFLNEFEEFVRARKEGKGTELPQYILLYLPADHTAGTRPNHPRPAACVADNDLALGRVVEAVSNSPYWDDTAIFVLEDDAQDGADHVDAHRSIALVISKYSPGSLEQPFIDSSFYTTVNMIHTIEVLLGLPPMNQNDAWAPVMAPLFSGRGTQPAFKADYRNRDNGLIYEVNAREAPGAKESAAMDFSRPDAVNTPLLNAILWKDAKGEVPMPEAKHTVIPVKAAVSSHEPAVGRQ